MSSTFSQSDLWVYWEGYKPRWIEVCLGSIAASCSPKCKFRLITPISIYQYLNPISIPQAVSSMVHVAHRADYFRAALLAKYGGFYFDADTVGLRCPSELATNHDLVYCCWDQFPRRVLNGYVYCQPGSELAKQWLEEITQVLIDYSPEVGIAWNALGEPILTKLVESSPIDSTLEVKRSTFLPVDIDSNPMILLANRFPEEFIGPESVCFGLNHSWMMANRPGTMRLREEFWPSRKTLFHRLMLEAKDEIEI